MTTLNLNNINDDLIELNRDTFNNKQMSFKIPNKHQRASQNNFMNDDVLFNKNKISNDVISMSSRSSSRSSSRASSVNGDYDKSDYMKNMKNIYRNKSVVPNISKKSKYDDDNETNSIISSSSNKKFGQLNGSSSGGGNGGREYGGSSKIGNNFKKQDRYEEEDEEDDEEDDDDGEDDEEGEEGEEGEDFYFDEEDGVEESGDESEDFEDSLRRWSKSTDPDVRMDVVKMTDDVELLEHLSQDENKLVRHNALKKLEKLM
jgi:regulator of nonsense transcripts 2